jgi:8-oxo-dGTP diphosphatase
MPAPVVGVGGVVIHDGRVLLIQRGKEPLKGAWVIPGGTVEWGESLTAALIREMREETGLVVRPGKLLVAFDRIAGSAENATYHYVILDYLCEWIEGEPVAGSDAAAVAWARPQDLATLGAPEKVTEVIRLAFDALGLAWPLGEG